MRATAAVLAVSAITLCVGCRSSPATRHPVMGWVNTVKDTETQFNAICGRLTSLLVTAQPDTEITKDTTSKAFTARYDTMVYTVHKNRGRGNVSSQTCQEVGPRVDGFVVDVRIVPINPVSALSGQTFQEPYWKTYFWYGHVDNDQYVHFVLKFGEGVKKSLRYDVIRAVTELAQQGV